MEAKKEKINHNCKDVRVINTGQKKKVRYCLGSEFAGIYFTQREGECMACLLNGWSFRSIAQKLKLSPRTVEDYAAKIRKKLNCRNKSELIIRVQQSNFPQFQQLVLQEIEEREACYKKEIALKQGKELQNDSKKSSPK